MKKLSEIFNYWYGVNLEFINCIEDDNGIPFVSRTSKNNGVVGKVMLIEGIEPNPPHTLSLAGGGSVLSCFYQDKPYYSGRDLFILSPKDKMTKEEMLLYSYIISFNKYKYNYGRQANKTFKDLLLPELSEIQFLLNGIPSADCKFDSRSTIDDILNLDVSNWKAFRYDEVFIIRKGFYNKKPEDNPQGNIPFIGATDSNNGITSYTDLETIERCSKTGEEPNAPLAEKLFPGNCITVSNNGSVGYAFYQPVEFTCSHDVNPLYLKDHELNVYIAIFLCTLISLEQYRWDYGRKWRPIRMPSSIIKLPVDKEDNPDWDFMENYIKSLPYSSIL